MVGIRRVLRRRNQVLGCDACLMNMIEIAYEMQDAIDFMVGSEETEPADHGQHQNRESGDRRSQQPAPAIPGSADWEGGDGVENHAKSVHQGQRHHQTPFKAYHAVTPAIGGHQRAGGPRSPAAPPSQEGAGTIRTVKLSDSGVNDFRVSTISHAIVCGVPFLTAGSGRRWGLQSPWGC